MAKHRIVLEFADGKYHAYLASDSTIKGIGDSWDAAIGQMIDFNRECFDCEISLPRPKRVEIRSHVQELE